MAGMLAGAMTRGIMVGCALAGAMLLWPGVSLSVAHPWAVVWFGLMGTLMLSLVGLMSSIWAEKFDHNAAITNFVIQPMALLSGTFYVIDNLSPAFQAVSRVNPFFYIISGFRFGFLGQSDIGATNQAVLHGALGLGDERGAGAGGLQAAQVGVASEGVKRPGMAERKGRLARRLFRIRGPS
jgi:ABC-2 type transport system permease protein